jgi:hypothetical protein
MTSIPQELRDRELWSAFFTNTRRSYRFMMRQDWFGLSMLALLILFVVGPMVNVFIWAFTERAGRYP